MPARTACAAKNCGLEIDRHAVVPIGGVDGIDTVAVVIGGVVDEYVDMAASASKAAMAALSAGTSRMSQCW